LNTNQFVDKYVTDIKVGT